MKIQGFKRIITEDYPEKDRPLIQKLAYAVNVFAEDITNLVNNNISIADNLNITQKDINVTVDVTGVPTNLLTVKTGLKHQCLGITVIKVTDLVTPNRAPSGTPFISFNENSGIITITNITNLVGNNSYTLRILLF